MSEAPPFTKLLIANRGEIAVRILRTCRELGIRTVAVYSEPDRQALHVRYSDEAYALGGKTPAESYLRGEAILEIAKKCGADAIHPGFGFLAENGEFAQSVIDAGICFVGPSPHAMKVMGDKLASRQAMVATGVPVVPGATEPSADSTDAAEVAEDIGYPVMLKASAGGGGKGIRIVRTSDEMESAFNTASGEATSAFGDGRMYVEKFVEEPRHVEIQVLGDQSGKVVFVGERECSIQRRHQKLIEESPCPVIDLEMRRRMGEAAVAAAKAVDYVTAGTVEFLWSHGEFYFLEMNTRIQVEHGITEEVYGIDLIEWMLRTAAGESLPFDSFEEPRGHSIEVRLNAEDPEKGFLPSIGKVNNLRLPGGPGVRVDSALYRGMEVTPYYDSMLAKLISTGPTRAHAIRRMERMLRELHVGGLTTSASVALEAILSKEFQSGQYDTGTLERMMENGRSPDHSYRETAAIIAALHRHHEAKRQAMRPNESEGSSQKPWVALGRQAQMRGGAIR
ncbi:MAG: acetyl-CoA carboxylase biotin carboxylase subunit [Planctomycetota bacterium]|nr:acetyl-CoA carboxylase biotin carboxylase subunit [Planctomycetota bacterium]